MNEETIINKQVSSFKLKQTAKGEYYWEITAYSEDVEAIKKKIIELDDWAKEKYGGMI